MTARSTRRSRARPKHLEPFSWRAKWPDLCGGIAGRTADRIDVDLYVEVWAGPVWFPEGHFEGRAQGIVDPQGIDVGRQGSDLRVRPGICVDVHAPPDLVHPGAVQGGILVRG